MKLICILACASALTAQEAVNYASIAGRVTDPSGSIVEGAAIVARQVATNGKRVTTTDREGWFRFPYLAAGAYEILASKSGFAAAKYTLTVAAGGAYDAPIALAIATADSSVTVSAEAAVVEPARTQIAATVGGAEVSGLPLNGRNFLDLALLAPGVSPTNTGSTQLFAETSAVPGQGISVGSQRNFSNNFLVDGLSANDDAAGLSGIFYGLDVVREFQVVTGGGQAELGRALGGYINMVTKSGTNALHGDVYGYFRNQRLNAANSLLHGKLPMTQAQYGASVGGPLVRDRSFYFANFEQRELNQSGLITISPANVDAINARLTAVGYQGPRIATGLFSNPVHSENFLGKVDHQFGVGDQFAVRYSLYHVSSLNSRGAGALNAASASAALDNTDQTIAVSNVATISPRTVNETRGQFTRSNLAAPPADAVGPAVSIAGVATFGTMAGSPTARRNNLWEAADNLSHQSGAHALRAGVDFLYNDTTITYPRSLRGSYTFSSMANFLSGMYNNSGFTQTFGNSVAAQTNPNVGMYVQDEWRVSPSVTLNAGVRYDLQFLKSIATDKNNLSPRVGFAWSPGKDRRTVVRGSFGLFYDRVPLRAVANALLFQDGQVTVSLSPAQTGAPVFPNVMSAMPAGVLYNVTSMDRRIQNAYSESGSLEIERQIGGHATVSAGYEHLRGLHLIMSMNQNVPSCVASGNNNGCRPNPAFANNSQYSSLGDSHYDGLHVSFVQRPVRWGSYRVSYTWSKALDNVGEFFFSGPIDNFNVWRDYGRSDDDQRHRLVVDGVLHTRVVEVSGMLAYYSALPLNITTGQTTIQGTSARPVVNGDYIGRNIGTGFDQLSLNARVSRRFRLTERMCIEALAESFNALNHVNGVTRNGVFGTGAFPFAPAASFGQVTAVGDARSGQLALRLRF
jgi:Carboxypeptidase regulatory-like domain/TonB dependent receptor-like, beta-barrel